MMSSSASTTKHTEFDALGRVLKSEHWVDGTNYTFTYGYNHVAMTSQGYPSGRVVNYGYDGAGRVETVNGQMGTAATPYVTNVDDFGKPSVWNGPFVLSREFANHFSQEGSIAVNPSRFYLGVRLAVGIYLASFRSETDRFKDLEMRIIKDARVRAFVILIGGDPRTIRGSFPSPIEEEALAQCYAGNPAACR